jgi:hypothetical protein
MSYNNTNVMANNAKTSKNKKTKKVNVKTAIPFQNLRGNPNMVKKQSAQNANYNANTKTKSKSISGCFNLSPFHNIFILS